MRIRRAAKSISFVFPSVMGPTRLSTNGMYEHFLTLPTGARDPGHADIAGRTWRMDSRMES